jgi:hypothetical protein
LQEGYSMSGTDIVPEIISKRQPHPWERQPGETNKAWNAFRIYRDMDAAERTIKSVSKQLGYSVTALCERWSRLNDWVSRAGTYDAHMDEQRRNRRERERLAASDRRVQIAKNMQLVGGAAIQELGTKIQEALQKGKPIPKISLKDATAIINAGVQIERLESGESTSNIALEGMILIDDVVKRERELIEIVKEAIRANTEPETAKRISGYIESRCTPKH